MFGRHCGVSLAKTGRSSPGYASVKYNRHHAKKPPGMHHQRVVWATAQEIQGINHYLSLGTVRSEVDGKTMRQVALVDEREHILVDLLLLGFDANEETGVGIRIPEDMIGIVSVKQASEVMRSHLSRTTVLVSLAHQTTTKLLGLEEGRDFGSHLALNEVFSVFCEHCQKKKMPSRSLLMSMTETLPIEKSNEDLSRATDNAILSCRLFKYYLEIKDDEEAWKAMTHRLLQYKKPIPTETISVVEQQAEERDHSKMNIVKGKTRKATYSPRGNKNEERRNMASKGLHSKQTLFSIDAEFILLKGGYVVVGQVALVDEHGRVLLNAYIKQNKPVLKYGTAVNGLTKEILEIKGISFFKAVAILKRRLKKDAVLVGLGIDQDIKMLQLKEGRDFYSAVNLGDIFDSFVCPVCHTSSRPSLDHLSEALLGTKSDGSPHDAANDAKRSIEIYKRYLSVKDDPKALDQLRQRISETPKPPPLKGGLGDKGLD